MTPYKRKRIKTGSETYTTITTTVGGGKRIGYTHKSRGTTRTKSGNLNKLGTRLITTYNSGGWLKRDVFSFNKNSKGSKKRSKKMNTTPLAKLFLFLLFIGLIAVYFEYIIKAILLLLTIFLVLYVANKLIDFTILYWITGIFFRK